MKIPDVWNDHPAFGEAQMVLGPLDITPAEEIESYRYDDEAETDWLIFRWNSNAVTMIFDGTMIVSLSCKPKADGGSLSRYGIDFFITDPIPEVFFKTIEKKLYR